MRTTYWTPKKVHEAGRDHIESKPGVGRGNERKALTAIVSCSARHRLALAFAELNLRLRADVLWYRAAWSGRSLR